MLLAVASWAVWLLAVASWAGWLLAVLSVAAGLLLAVLSVGLLVVASWAAELLLAVTSCTVWLLAVASCAVWLLAVLSAMLIFSDLPVSLCPLPNLDGVAAISTLPTVPLGAALVAGFFPLSRRALANFLCLTGGVLSELWLLATLPALLHGALQKPVTTGTTGPADVVAEVLGWDLESRALGD
ncbi:hypothetical protein NDU88_003402 [Pleurodeles waltl]|uniref:Uncharacterized protein n=1 Tax=Pleurodeles waltl TaxID=8319 RepID=A0AAV7NGK2_PLEWA|nr:hypothetical protein NDU88_003402 [Pleurodeles waltl]